MNPLIKMMASQANNDNPITGMITRFADFKKQWTPASANAKINELLESGQVTRQQYEQAKQMAERFRSIIK